jgi:aspartyl-tRNA(Asn)/glutamyl-tRNA(Gln) amidotransferase subunit A
MSGTFVTAAALARSYAEGQADPVSAVRGALERAEQVPHAFISLTPERALQEARA